MARNLFDPDCIKVPPEEQTAGSGQRPLSVSELTAMVKRALSRLPGTLAVAGEVSNFSRSPAGHLYFTLKDQSAAVNCVMWKSDAARLKFTPEDGLAVVAFGRIDLYEPRGQYQLYVTRLLPSGRGELELAFRQLCEKLQKLGWFDAARKRPIPRIPRTIAVVTSLTGAAVRDILRTLAIRWPAARVVIADARVQGEGASESIAAAIECANRHASAIGGMDVLIVARGGGSLEDLWAFNTEAVARAILKSAIPVVTGIGHEIDTTIADLVADLRTATPTAAAQAVVPDRVQVARQVAATTGLLRGVLRRRLDESASRLAACARAEAFRRPRSLFRDHRQLLDELAGRLADARRDLLEHWSGEVGDLGKRLAGLHPRAVLAERGRHVDRLATRLRWALGKVNLLAERRLRDASSGLAGVSPRLRLPEIRRVVERIGRALRANAARGLSAMVERLDARRQQLAAYDPRAVLRRGYSMTRLRRTGTLLTSATQAKPGERLLTELADGRVESDVISAGRSDSAPPLDSQTDQQGQMKLGF